VNKIGRYGGFSAVHDILEQTTRSRSPEFMNKMLTLLDRLIREVPVWRMECNMDVSAAIMSHAVMSGENSK